MCVYRIAYEDLYNSTQAASESQEHLFTGFHGLFDFIQQYHMRMWEALVGVN